MANGKSPESHHHGGLQRIHMPRGPMPHKYSREDPDAYDYALGGGRNKASQNNSQNRYPAVKDVKPVWWG